MTGSPQQGSPQDGFSVLEMIVAMTILALVLGTASQSILLASRSIAAAKRKLEAARIVRIMLADYETGARTTVQPGWRLQTRTIEVAKAKFTAIIVEKTDGAFRSEPFLTFMPAPDTGAQ